MNAFKFKIGDFFLIGLLLLVSVSVFIYTRSGHKGGQTLIVYQGDYIKNEYLLNKDQILKIDGPLGMTQLTVRSGKAFVSESPCPYHFCQKSGTIARAGEMIVCVPNKVIIKIKGESANHLDAVTE